MQTEGIKDPTDEIAGNLDKNTKTVEGLSSSFDYANYSAKALFETLKTAIDPANILKTKIAIEDMAMTLTMESLGQTKTISEGIEKAVAKATYETSLFGINADDNLRLMGEINEVMEVNTLLSSEQITNMQLLARSSGAASKDIATMVKGFKDLGIGTDEAIKNIHNMGQQARSYGINVSQFMGKISENIKKLSAYNFKDGIQGFSNMLAKAQALRIDVGQTFKLAEDLLEPDKAIEMAAGFQMVGGAIGSLGDPFKLLHMAQTDVAGLQDELIKASESAVTFNEETGEFDIPVTEMYRLKEMAQLTGKSYEQMADEAIKAKQRTEKLKLLENAVGGYTEEQKELIANLAEFGENGELKVKLPGMDEMVDATSLTKDQLEQLDDLQKDQAKSAEEVSREIRDINKDQLSVLQALEGTKAQVGAVSLLKAEETPLYGDVADVFKTMATEQGKRVDTAVKSPESQNQGMLLTKMVEEGFSNPNTIQAYAAGQLSLIQQVFGNMDQYFKDVSLGLEEENVFKDIKILDKFGESMRTLGVNMEGFDVDRLNTITNTLFENLNQLYIEQDTGQNTERTIVTDTLGNDNVSLPLPPALPEVNEVVEVRPEMNETPFIPYDIPEPIGEPVAKNTEGEIKVNGTINLTLNGMDLEKIDVVELTKNAEFRAKVRQIALNEGTTYT